MTASISEVVFGHLDDGTTVKRYTLRNQRGTEAVFANLGASWLGFKRPEDDESLVLGCDTLDTLSSQMAFMGATVGRFANRIGQGQFQMNDQTHQLEVNLPPHHLHGGSSGLSHKVWDSHITLVDDKIPTLTFRCHSEDGASGYPGNLNIEVTITLADDDRVQFKYNAQTDASTPISLTNHAYFNLAGESSGNLHGQEARIDSELFLESDETALPTGQIVQANGTGLDFSDWTDIAERLSTSDDPRLERASGLDHCFCYAQDRTVRRLASVRSKKQNVVLECFSDLPGMQFYTGNFLGGTPKNDAYKYNQHGAFCLEPGFWPDSPNHSDFPDCFFNENSPYSAIIEYSFKTMDE